MTVLFERPEGGVQLCVEPELASWDKAGSRGQVRLARFLDHVADVVAPMMAAISGQVAVELTVGLPDDQPLASGGRDLDNYLLPVARRLGPQRIAAMLGRKVRGPSRLAVAPARARVTADPAMLSARLTGSYERVAWKQQLRGQLALAGATEIGPGPVALEISITTGTGRNWASLWKPMIDAFGPVLGEDPARPFHPRDDRITSLSLHHHLSAGISHDVIISAWWSGQ